MKIDLHVHIHRTSRCAKASIEDMAKAALSLGIDGIVVLDHNYQSTEDECKKAEILFPEIKIFRGIEMNVWDEDVVIISSKTITFAPQYKQKFKDISYLSKWIKDTNSLLILAHPYRRHEHISFDMDILRPHAVEIAGRHVNIKNRGKIAILSERYGMNHVSVSDAHKPKQLGGFCIKTDYSPSNEQELIDIIKSGSYTPLESKLVPVYVWNI